MNFSVTETNLMIMYNTGSREGLIEELEGMIHHIPYDEQDLYTTTYYLILKLKTMSNAAFNALELGKW
jgi:hypothetical protein